MTKKCLWFVWFQGCLIGGPVVPARCIYNINEAIGIKIIKYPSYDELPMYLLPPKSFNAPLKMRPWRPYIYPQHMQESYIAVLNEAYVVPVCWQRGADRAIKNASGTVFDKNQQFLLNIFKKVTPCVVKNRMVEQYEKLAPIFHFRPTAFYHFVAQDLCRLTLLLDILAKDREIKLLVDGLNSRLKWVRQYLQLFDLEDRCIMAEPNHLYFAKKLFFARPEYYSLAGRASMMRTRDRVFKTLGIRPCPKSERRHLVILERKSTVRNIENFEQLIGAIKNSFPHLSNDIIRFTGGEPIAEQVKIFRAARIIVGPHGAGLVNMIYAAPGTPVIEFYPDHVRSIGCFRHLAAQMHMNHWIIFISNPSFGSSMHVPIKSTISLMRTLLGEEKKPGNN